MSQSSLFRTEVLQARRQQWLGAVALDQPPTQRWLVVLAVLACVGIGFGLSRGEYTRRTAVTGLLVPSFGVSTVTAPVSGTLAGVAVQEGQRVLAGQALATIDIPGATSHGATGAALADSLQQRRIGMHDAFAARRRQLLAEAESMRVQRDLAQSELHDLDRELATRQRQQALADATLARFRMLQAQRFVTALQLQQQESAALEQLAAAQALRRQRAALQRQLAQVDQALAAAPEQLAQLQAEAERESALLQQEDLQLQSRRDAVVPAPLAGIVATLLVQPGQGVQAGQPLLSLLPAASRLEAHLLVPGHAIGFVAPGDRVLLRYAAFPYQKYGQQGGCVLRVSGVALPGTEADDEPLFRVVVAPDRQQLGRAGDAGTLRSGLRLDAHLLGERRRLWEWVLEPLQTLRASLSESDGATRRQTGVAASGGIAADVRHFRDVGPRRGARGACGDA